MAKVIFKHEKVEMIQQDKPVVFLCHHCKQSANEAPVRANYTDKKVLTYHPHCAREVISEISNPKRKYEDTSMKDLGIVGISGKSVNVKKQTFIQPVVDLDLERKKAKLEALLSGDQYREEVEEEEDRQSKKLKAHITLEPNGMLGFRHKYDAEMVKKYHMIREIKWNNGFNIWECNIKSADYETVRFILKIFKEADHFDWLISDTAFTAIKSRLDHHESRIKESKEIKELKTKTDVEIELPHMKISPYPYQKVGIAFLDKVDGVGMLGDVMGIGKCLIEGKIVSSEGLLDIKELFDFNKKMLNKDSMGGEWYSLKKQIKVQSVRNGQIVYNKIEKLYRQEIKEKVKSVTLMDGTNIKCTLAHKLLTLNGWNNEIKKNDYVLVPRIIEPNFTKKIDDDLAYFLAWLISEGNEDSKIARMTITQHNQNTLKSIRKSLLRYSRKYNIKANECKVKKNKIEIFSRSLVDHLKNLGYFYGQKSATKQIPNFILNAEDSQVITFLRNYFEAEGSVSKSQKIVEITSASEEIMKSLSLLLRRWGIWLRYTPRKKMATNGKRIKRTYYVGMIGGTSLRTFYKNIGFSGKSKQKALKKLCLAKINDNVDIIPSMDLSKIIVENAKISPVYTIIEGVYLNQNFSRTTAMIVLKKLDDLISGKTLKDYLKLKKSKWTESALKGFNSINKERIIYARNELKSRLEYNCFFTKVKNVKYNHFSGYVYDLSIKKDHNYICNGIYSHNTIQAIGYTSLKNYRTIVVCPASLKYNWKKEIEKFTNKSAVVLTELESSSLDPKNTLADYRIINYEQLDKYSKYLSKTKFDCVILDESHYIMNLQAKRTKLVFKLFKKAEGRILLSGTPIKNRPVDFYPQLKFLRPDLFGNKMQYALRYCDAKETPFGWDYRGASNLEELNRKISSFYIRRLKNEVLKELPPKTVSVIDVDFNVTEKKEYEKIRRDFDRFLKESWVKVGTDYVAKPLDGADLSKLVEMKQYCSQAKIPRVIEFVKEFVESTENRKILVFSQFIATQKALRDAFPGISVSLLGEDSAEKRQEAVEKFQTDPKIRVFVGSTIAAGVGLTLTAADTVVFADLMWSPSDHEQAADRVHRIGQENPVFIYYLVFKDSIESMIWDIIGKKLSIINEALDGKKVKEAYPDARKAIFNQLIEDFKKNR